MYDSRWDLENARAEHCHESDVDSDDGEVILQWHMNPKCGCRGSISFGLSLQEIDERTPDEYCVLGIRHKKSCYLDHFNPRFVDQISDTEDSDEDTSS